MNSIVPIELAHPKGRCPLWIISGHMRCDDPCLLYTQKRTCAVHQVMSALGQKRTFATQNGMSPLPPRADIGGVKFPVGRGLGQTKQTSIPVLSSLAIALSANAASRCE